MGHSLFPLAHLHDHYMCMTLPQHFTPEDNSNHGKSASLLSNEAGVLLRMSYTGHKTSSNELWKHLIFKVRPITFVIRGFCLEDEQNSVYVVSWYVLATNISISYVWPNNIFPQYSNFSTCLPVSVDRFDTRQVIRAGNLTVRTVTWV